MLILCKNKIIRVETKCFFYVAKWWVLVMLTCKNSWREAACLHWAVNRVSNPTFSAWFTQVYTCCFYVQLILLLFLVYWLTHFCMSLIWKGSASALPCTILYRRACNSSHMWSNEKIYTFAIRKCNKKSILVSFLAHKHHASTIMISIILQSPSHPHMRQYLPIPSDYRSLWLLSKGEALVKPLGFMRFAQFPRKLPTNMLDDDIPDVVFFVFL